MEAQIELIRRELERLREKSELNINERHADRVRLSEVNASIQVTMAQLDARLSSLEAGMLRLMSHSTWLLRLISGGILVAILNFALEGGLLNGLS